MGWPQALVADDEVGGSEPRAKPAGSVTGDATGAHLTTLPSRELKELTGFSPSSPQFLRMTSWLEQGYLIVVFKGVSSLTSGFQQGYLIVVFKGVSSLTSGFQQEHLILLAVSKMKFNH